MINPLLIFRNLYKGRTDAYGLHDPTLDKEYKTVRAPVTTELYNKHLEGQHSLGFIPITPDGKCSAGFVDDDSHKKDKSKPVQKYDYNKLLHKINSLGLPVVVTKSKSGGAHIWIFVKEKVPAADMQRKIVELAAALGDDANFSTTVTNSIATKLPLAGGTLTGSITGTIAAFSWGVTVTG